jgi:pSer/pThr/pTyr-binding forkhead associated (FHA) protein
VHLVVKENGQTVNEFRFDKGPIYIGRQENSQVCLADGTVSRQHAVIFSTQDGKWMVEDLDSANKTYLNDQAIHKSEIKTGDFIRITSHTIEINLNDGEVAEKPVQPEDTLTATAGATAAPAAATAAPAAAPPAEAPARTTGASTAPAGARATPAGAPQIIERKLDTPDAPALRLPAHRVTELLRACEVIGKAANLDELLLA